MSPAPFTSIVFALSFYAASVSSKHDASRNSLHRKHRPHQLHVARFKSPTLPSGWSYLGCKGEPSGARILSAQMQSSSTNNKASTCIAQCTAKNYVYAGTEYGQECWCGNALNQPSTVSESSCSTACTGDSNEACGAGYVVSLYGKSTTPTRSTTSTWTSLGCFQDQWSRTLSGPSTSSGSMTQEVCESFCSGYTYAGVENNGECYCGNTLTTNQPLAASNCNAKCNGNANEICGGNNWQLSVFQATSTITTTTTTTSPTPTASTSWTNLGCFQDQWSRTLSGPSTSSGSMTQEICESFCTGYTYAGVENNGECYCGNTLTTNQPIASSNCNAKCNGNPNEMCGGNNWQMNILQASTSSTSTSTTTTTSSAPSSTGWTSLGCYGDWWTRTLSGSSTASGSMTQEICENFCVGYTYAGVENNGECYCGNTLTTNQPLPASNCNAKCNGNANEMCGGNNWQMNIFQRGSATSSSSTSTTTTTTSSATPTSTGVWTNLGCYYDQSARTLSSISKTGFTGMTQESCQAFCFGQGYKYAGAEYSSECYCGNTLNGSPAPAGDCSSTCNGNSTEICGGGWRATVFLYGPATTSSTTATTTTSSTGTNPTGGVTPGNGWTNNAPNTGKLVVAHFMVGNAYSYTPAQWTSEIQQAYASGIDAFVLNMGSSPDWEPSRMQDAYNAATQSGTPFKLFISFDMSAISCGGYGDAGYVSNLITTFAALPAQLKDSTGAAYVSTFAGDACGWGASGWYAAVKGNPAAANVRTKFIPSFFGDPGWNAANFGSFMDGMFPWNNGWPMGNYDVPWGPDVNDLQFVNRAGGQQYMAPVSPWFFTHYSPSSWNKNWIYRGDDWLYPSRWEMLFNNRNQIDLVEIITWNDYGESSYIGPIGLDQPNSQAWVNGFPHTAWLTLTGYYASAFKTGVYPTLTSDKIYMWARPHGRDAYAPDPACGQPANAAWTNDVLWIILFATSSGNLAVTQGSSTANFSVTSGVNKLQMPSGVTSTGVTAILTRNNVQIFSWFAPITFTLTPPTYNFNAFVFNGP